MDFKYSTTPVGIDHYITSSVLGSQRFSFSGFAGMQISVGGSPITVTALGRMTAVGNSGTHLLKLVNASDGSDVPGGSVTVSMSGATAGQFQYSSLANPVVLSAGQTYYLVSQETSGGDAWFYDDTIVKSTSVAVETCAIWGDGQGQWHLDGSSGQSFGPVDFNYTTNAPTNAPPKPQRYVIGQTVGTPRNGFTGFAGMQIVVGDNPLTVSALGRMVLDGNSGTHIVKLVNASDGSDVPGGTVSISMSGATVGQFQYVDLSSSVVLSAGGTYYLVSQETSGGDSWYYDDTVVDTTSVATQTAAAWASDSGQWHLDGTANHCFGPLDFKCIPIGGVALVQ